MVRALSPYVCDPPYVLHGRSPKNMRVTTISFNTGQEAALAHSFYGCLDSL